MPLICAAGQISPFMLPSPYSSSRKFSRYGTALLGKPSVAPIVQFAMSFENPYTTKKIGYWYQM